GAGEGAGDLLAQRVLVVGGGDVPRVGGRPRPAVVPVGVGGVVADRLPVGGRRADPGEPTGGVVAVDGPVRRVVVGVVRVVGGELLLHPVQLVVGGLLDKVVGRRGRRAAW